MASTAGYRTLTPTGLNSEAMGDPTTEIGVGREYPSSSIAYTASSNATELFASYEPQTEDPGPYLWLFSLAVCVATYLVLLPVVVAIERACCSSRGTGDLDSSSSSKRQWRRPQNRNRGFAVLVPQPYATEDEDQEEGTNMNKSAFGQMWDQFHDEEYPTTPRSLNGNRHPEVQLQWNEPPKAAGSLSSFLVSILEFYQPNQRSFFHRQRQQRRERALHQILKEESNAFAMDQHRNESSGYPLLRGSDSGQSWTELCCRGCCDTKAWFRLRQWVVQFATPDLVQGILQLGTLVLIGIGLESTSDLTAYLIVHLFVVRWSLQGVSSAWLAALQELTQEQSHTVTATQVGQYTQITLTLLITSFMPIWILWTLTMRPFLEWLQMDQETTKTAIRYTYIALVLTLLQAMSECVHFLLVRAKHSTYSTTMVLLQQILVVVIIAVWSWLDDADLVTFGLVQIEITVAFLVWNVGVALYSGWLEAYRSGLLGNCAMVDSKALYQVIKTALPLIVGNIFLGSTWEILAFLAAFLGPAEFTVWCILGVIWESTTLWLEGMAFVVSVRCEAMMRLGKPKQAFWSSVKGIVGLMAFPATLVAAAILVVPNGMLSTWITRDDTIQDLLTDLLPLLAIGLVVTSMSSATWALMYAQGQNHVAAFVAWLASWFVSVPLATTCSVHLVMDLQCQTVAFILGSLLTGAIQCYLFATFRWEDSNNEAATMTTIGHSMGHSTHSIPSSQRTPPLREAVELTRSGQAFQNKMRNALEIMSLAPSPTVYPDPEIDLHSTSSSDSSDSGVFDNVGFVYTSTGIRPFPDEGDIPSQDPPSWFGSDDSTLSTGGCVYTSTGIRPFPDEGDIPSQDPPSWFGSDDSTLSTGGSSMMSTSLSSVSYSASASLSESSSNQNSSKLQRVYSMEGSSPNINTDPTSKAQARNMSSMLNARRLAPMSPVIEESSSHSHTGSESNISLAASDWMGCPSDETGSSASESKKATGDINNRRRRPDDLGSLSRKELVRRQQELTKMLNALKATRRYELSRSKLRILEELGRTMLESPDIFDVKHLERIIGLLRIDEDCRKELWMPLCQYLPAPLRSMGLDKLLENDCLGAHHLKARMDKYVMDVRLADDDGSSELDSFFDDNKVHDDCELPPFAFPSCFVMLK